MPTAPVSKSILTFVRFKHILSTSKEVDFFAFKERKHRFRWLNLNKNNYTLMRNKKRKENLYMIFVIPNLLLFLKSMRMI